MSQSALQQPNSLPSSGDRFAERYELDRLLGYGGFANVYRAVQLDLQRQVAIKILASNRRSDAEMLNTAEKRFYREARLLSQLHSPHTVRMYDYGRSSEGLLFMVFEFIDGSDLRDMIRARGPLEEATVRRILLQVLDSLREAHALSILHRDIKPANVMVYERFGQPNCVKVLDFGIAKSVAAEVNAGQQLTMDGLVVGTPRYMSPEQALGRPLGAPSDLFSVGLIAYEMIMGRSPFDSAELQMVRRQMLSGPLLVPRSSGMSDQLRHVVNKLLERQVEERFQSVDAVLDALGESRTSHDTPAPEPQPRPSGLSFPLALDSSGLPPVDDLTGMSQGALADTTIATAPPTMTSAVFDTPDVEEPPPAVPSQTSRAPAPAPSAPPRPQPTQTVDPVEPVENAAPRRDRLAVGALFAIALAGASLFMLWPEQTDTTPTPSATAAQKVAKAGADEPVEGDPQPATAAEAPEQDAPTSPAEPTPIGPSVDAARSKLADAADRADGAAREAAKQAQRDARRYQRRPPRRKPTPRKSTRPEKKPDKPAGFKPIDDLL